MLITLKDLRHNVLVILDNHRMYENFHHMNDIFHLLLAMGLGTVEDVKDKIWEFETDYMNEISEQVQREAEEDASNFRESFPGEMA